MSTAYATQTITMQIKMTDIAELISDFKKIYESLIDENIS